MSVCTRVGNGDGGAEEFDVLGRTGMGREDMVDDGIASLKIYTCEGDVFWKDAL